MHDRRVQGIPLPPFLYGTAWKEEETRRLTLLALESGFTGIDTANQRRHYHEAGVGEGIADFLAGHGGRRDALFLQTKFTSRGGQDHRLPYDPRAGIATQVEQSFASSLRHLGTDRLDSLVLHGPGSATTLTGEDWQAWRAMEAIARAGGTRLIGISNVTRAQLELLLAQAAIAPAFVQNRCYARRGWDREVRSLCAAEGIVYQGFSLLTANADALRHPTLRAIAARHSATVAQVVFAFALAAGMLPLTGTTREAHMREDLASLDLELRADEIERIESVAG
jgi:diketogulonate reductase-like aldo/keto reductase